MLSDRFATLRSRQEKALVLFVTAGDPELKELPAILETLQEGGADAIELGIPFSDPIADGPTIQASSQRALDRGVTPDAIFEQMERVQLEIPLVLMGYFNPILRKGLPTFAERARQVGFSGSIVSDLTPEESDEWRAASQDHGLDTIFLAAPTSTEDRIRAVCTRSSGFVYAISRTGVTGAGQQVPPDVVDLVRRIQAQTTVPVCVGFGISQPEHVRMVCEVADGAVIGSWLVDRLAKDWNGGAGESDLRAAIRSLKEATR